MALTAIASVTQNEVTRTVEFEIGIGGYVTAVSGIRVTNTLDQTIAFDADMVFQAAEFPPQYASIDNAAFILLRVAAVESLSQFRDQYLYDPGE